jgi:hypothetical protein
LDDSFHSNILQVAAIVLIIIGFSLSLVAFGCVCGWANEQTEKDQQWLGQPNYLEHTVFAWHPLLMVCGFWFSQLVSLCTWTFLPDGFVYHWFFQVAALSTFVAGLCAIVKYKLYYKYHSLVTMHSWLGVVVIILFGSNFLNGWFTTFSGSFNEKYGRYVDLKYVYKLITLMVFCFTCASIATGIVARHGREGCYYIGDYNRVDRNPARRYHHIPNSCKISFGLGLCAVFATICIVLAVTIDGFDINAYKEPQPAKPSPTIRNDDKRTEMD